LFECKSIPQYSDIVSLLSALVSLATVAQPATVAGRLALEEYPSLV